MRNRAAFAYVVGIEGAKVSLNLKDEHRGYVSSHRDGVSAVMDVGSLFGVEFGSRVVVLKTQSLAFSEPREVHRWTASASPAAEPLRHLIATTVGYLQFQDGQLRFVSDALISPPLGAEAFPLTADETRTVFRLPQTHAPGIVLGESVRGFGAVSVEIDSFLSRHVAVLGGTGQGKSCFTAAILQQLLKLPQPRIVVFDVNGEYSKALRPHATDQFKYTVLGGSAATLRIPYFALGRHGLARMLLPSEKTQRPALNFALENLAYVENSGDGVRLVGGNAAVLFDDCRMVGADAAWDAIEKLRSSTAKTATSWPAMHALACLVAESHALKPGKNGKERDPFSYGNVAPLVTRIKRCLDDPMFTSVVSTVGASPHRPGALDWSSESRFLVEQIFGGPDEAWNVHVVDLRNVAHDLMPLILGSLLELFAFELFNRGQGNTFPTLLVLEEAHHYLRQFAEQEEFGRQALAYERLAKEGRKFGLSLWLSTQRPAEVSATVLAQCGTWVTFRLSGDADLRALATASEWIDRSELSSVAGLPRQQAFVFGSSVATPVRIIASTADPTPDSNDPDFSRWTIGRNQPQATSIPEAATPRRRSPAKRN